MQRALRLPTRLDIQLVRVGGAGGPLAGVLVGLEILHHGRFYFGTALGLTDDQGRVSVSGDAIRRSFDAHRARTGVQDDVDLSDCDPVLGIHVTGGPSFVAAQSMAATDGEIAPEHRTMWASARNATIQSARREVRIGDDLPAVVAVRLPVTPVA